MRISINVSDSNKDFLVCLADYIGVSVSQLCSALIANQIIKVKGELKNGGIKIY